MGYRSNVTIVMKKTDFKKLLEETKNNECVKNLMKLADLRQNNEETLISLNWNCIKWYDCFEEVNYINNFLKELDDYYLVIIGENVDDCEELLSTNELDYSDFYNMVELIRTVNLHGDEIDISDFGY